MKNNVLLTHIYLDQALEEFPLKEKKICILHSVDSYLSEVLLSRGAQSVEISFSPTDYKSFDAVFIVLSLKKLGAQPYEGSYADIEAMKQAKDLVKKDGLLYLSIPVGIDYLVENSHRIYGENRMKMLFKGWRPVGYFGYSYEDLLKESRDLHEPVFVLKSVK